MVEFCALEKAPMDEVVLRPICHPQGLSLRLAVLKSVTNARDAVLRGEEVGRPTRRSDQRRRLWTNPGAANEKSRLKRLEARICSHWKRCENYSALCLSWLSPPVATALRVP